MQEVLQEKWLKNVHKIYAVIGNIVVMKLPLFPIITKTDISNLNIDVDWSKLQFCNLSLSADFRL